MVSSEFPGNSEIIWNHHQSVINDTRNLFWIMVSPKSTVDHVRIDTVDVPSMRTNSFILPSHFYWQNVAPILESVSFYFVVRLMVSGTKVRERESVVKIWVGPGVPYTTRLFFLPQNRLKKWTTTFSRTRNLFVVTIDHLSMVSRTHSGSYHDRNLHWVVSGSPLLVSSRT